MGLHGVDVRRSGASLEFYGIKVVSLVDLELRRFIYAHSIILYKFFHARIVNNNRVIINDKRNNVASCLAELRSAQ